MFLGIEIGGTKLQLGVGVGTGEPFVDFRRFDVDCKAGAAGIRDQIASAGRELAGEHAVERIGFGFGGPVDAVGGRVITSHQIDGWDDFPLVAWCEERLGRPVVLGNDCDCAALAEARFGAGRDSQTVFYVTVGTGIGGGLVIGGVLHGRGRPAVAEIGHLRPGPLAVDATSTVESISSGRGIERRAAAAIESTDEAPSTRLLELCGGQPGRLSAKHVADAARDGDALALGVLEEAVRTLGWAVAQVVTLTAADRVVVGGGVSLMGEDLFYAPLRRCAAEYVFPPLADEFEIVAPELGEEVVVHGALALAADGVGR